jgi:hypothetical protein
VNEIYAAVVVVSGESTPALMAVTSGVLPPGLSLSEGLLSGIPTTPGSYAFTISAANEVGVASRSYTIEVAEIVTVALPDATTTAPYAEAIVVDGFTNPTFTVAAGALPNPLTLHPATGVISGAAPTEDGDFDFVVQVQDASATCLQGYTLTVEAEACLNFDNLTWLAPALQEVEGGTASGTSIAAVMTVEADAPVPPPVLNAYGLCYFEGSLVYTGPAATGNVHLVLNCTPFQDFLNEGLFSITIYHGVSSVLFQTPFVTGVYDYPFAIPESAGVTIEINAYGYATALFPDGPFHMDAVATLSATCP